MSDNTYNGWTNWETWLTALHINETPSILESFQEMYHYDKPTCSIGENDKILKEYIIEFFHEFSGGYVEETLHIESHHIDWNEICDSLYEDESWDSEDYR